MTPRILVPPELLAQPGGPVTLDRDQAHYLGQVLRLRVGDAIQVFDGQGQRFDSSVLELERKRAVISTPVPALRPGQGRAAPRLQLVQGLARGDRMDWVIEKSTELGVAAVRPLAARNSSIKLSGERAHNRCEHWRRVARAACMQCGQDTVPVIYPVADLPAVLRESTVSGNDAFQQHAPLLVLNPQADISLASWANQLAGQGAGIHGANKPVETVTLFVGPESGFSSDEVQQLTAAGTQSVSVGPRILRTETAGIAALCVLQALLGDLK